MELKNFEPKVLVFFCNDIETFKCRISNNNSKPKHNSIEASPNTKNVIEKQPASSIVEPTTPARVYKDTQTSSESSIKLNKLAVVNKKEKNVAQKSIFIKANHVNISKAEPIFRVPQHWWDSSLGLLQADYKKLRTRQRTETTGALDFPPLCSPTINYVHQL